MVPTRRVFPSILVLVCTLTLAQGRSSNTRAKEAEAFRDLHLEIAKQAKEHTNNVLANFSKWIENYKNKAADKYNDLHPQIQAIVHERVKEIVDKHVKDSLNEVINSAKLISFAQQYSQLSRDSRDSHHQNNGRSNNRNKNKQCDESEEENSSSQNKNEVNSKSINVDDLVRFVLEFTHAHKKIENLKFKLGNTWDAKENLTKAQLISKLEELREDLHKPVPSSSDKKDSSFEEDDESDDIDENVDDVNVIIESEINAGKHNIDTHREIRKHIFEILEPEIKALRSAKLEALNAKVELVQAANKLHTSPKQPGVAFDFQLLVQFKTKIFEVSFKKKQYINQRSLFKTQVKEAITEFKSNPGGTTKSVQQQSTEESEETVLHVSLGTAGLVGHTTDHVGLTTKRIKYTTEHAGHTTEHTGHTTDGAEHTTQEVGHTTQQAGPSTKHFVHTTEYDGDTPTQSVISHQISTNSHSAPEENQAPDEFADNEDGEVVNSSPNEIVSARASNSSNINAVANTQNDGESSGSQLRSTAGRAYNSSSNNANISDASGLRLAANYKVSEDADDGGGSGTVIVVVVLACLVICSVVSILGVLLWKRHRRHRLYTKIPSGDLSRQFI